MVYDVPKQQRKSVAFFVFCLAARFISLHTITLIMQGGSETENVSVVQAVARGVSALLGLIPVPARFDLRTHVRLYITTA